MQVINKTIKLSNDYPMPVLGFGTYGLSKDNAEAVILEALNVGYRHIETAPIYLNETAIAKAIQKSGIPREALFITSKIPPHIKTYDGTLRIIKRTMNNLGVDYLDALLINNPVPWGEEGKDYTQENVEVYRAMETLYNEEVVGTLGLSNFSVSEMEKLLPHLTITPHIHQVGVFIGHPLNDVCAYSHKQGMVIQGHSPLARGRIFKIDFLAPLAQKESMSIAQLALRYVLELGIYPVVKTESRKRMEENSTINKPLSKETFKTLNEYTKDIRDYLPPNAKYVL